MKPSKKAPTPERKAQILADLQRAALDRQQGYRDRALTVLPHICASCGREFEGKRLRELTVHHKDHNWKNNPPDGSNWELLCLFCHDHEHEKHTLAGSGPARENDGLAPSLFSPFENLDKLIAPITDDANSVGQDAAAPAHAPAPTDPAPVPPDGGAPASATAPKASG